MLRKSSSEPGGLTFGIGVWYSTTHFRGYCWVSRMLLKVRVTGRASSQANSWTTYFGMSPGTVEFGFFAAFILLYTSNSVKEETS